MGRGSSGIGGKSSYLSGYIQNNPWLNNMDEKMRKSMIDNFNNMPEEQKFYYSLTADEQSVLEGMQYNTKTLNEYMSGRRTDLTDEQKADLEKEISSVKSAIKKYTVQKPGTLYRGVSKAEFDSIASGKATDSFKSTSTDISRAKSFANNQGGYIVEYRYGKGARIADVGGVPGANEREYLIDSGVKYKKVKKVSDRHIVVEI